jgi:dTDP-4-amino-4,6-dideoxygalactose transaminase
MNQAGHHIPFNKPYLTGYEQEHIQAVLNSKKLSGGGEYTERCQSFFENKFGYKKCLMTTSCTDALEMCGILLGLKHGDEVIVPSYTFVTSASAFALRGAKIVFVDSEENHPNLDVDNLETLITPNTKAIVIVHYGGSPCDMDRIMTLAKQRNIVIIEDNAHGIGSYYKGKPLGSFGDFATLSFHDTKGITSGEGGMLVINNEKYIEPAKITWQKGTNRDAFESGEVKQYECVGLGSSFQASEITAALLWGQLIAFDFLIEKRKSTWLYYYDLIIRNGLRKYLPRLDYVEESNGQIFFLLLSNENQREKFKKFLFDKGVSSSSHFSPLHSSAFYLNLSKSECVNAELISNTLIRLPLFVEMTSSETEKVIDVIVAFFDQNTDVII